MVIIAIMAINIENISSECVIFEYNTLFLTWMHIFDPDEGELFFVVVTTLT